MTTADAIPNDPAVPPDRRWDATLLTQREQGRRNRRTIDSVSLGAAAIVIGLTAVVASSASAQDAASSRPSRPCSDGPRRSGASRSSSPSGFARRRRRRAGAPPLGPCARSARRGRILLAATSVLGRTVESDWFPIEAHLLARWGYPELRLAGATAVFVVVGPELVRPVRVLAAWLVPLAALGAVVLGAALPSRRSGRARARARRRRARAAGVRHRGGRAADRAGARRARRARCRRERPGAVGAAADRLRAEYVGHDASGRAAEGSRARPGRAGHAAARSPLAPPRLPRPAAERPRRAARAGRARGARNAPGGAGGRPGVPEVVTAAPRPGRRRADRHPPAPTSTRSSSRPRPGRATRLLKELWQQVGTPPRGRHLPRQAQREQRARGRRTARCWSTSRPRRSAPRRSSLDIDVAELLVACTVLVGPGARAARGRGGRLGTTPSPVRCRTCSAPR